MEIKKDYSLKTLNTFGIDAHAQFFAEAYSISQLKEIIQSKEFKNYPHLILGGGSNVLFTKDFEGIVVKIRIKGIDEVKNDAESIILKVEAGEIWEDFVDHCNDKNYGGIENLALIPGTVGAAPIQNIGAYGTELKDVFVKLEGINLTDGSVQKFTKEECRFGYRDSIFKRELKDKFIITSVFLSLNKNPGINLEYDALKKELSQQDITTLTIKDISNAVKRIRRSKLPDTNVLGNAGSFFKNPEVPEKHFLQLKEKYPEIIGYPAANNMIKIPAGWIIQKCGWRGKRIGDVGTYEKQALIIVNYGNARGEDVKSFSEKIKGEVIDNFGIILETEVNII